MSTWKKSGLYVMYCFLIYLLHVMTTLINKIIYDTCKEFVQNWCKYLYDKLVIALKKNKLTVTNMQSVLAYKLDLTFVITLKYPKQYQAWKL